MATQKTKFAVGLFVASGVSIAVLAIIWLGMSRFLEKGQHYAAYFKESVQGLDIDSPVKYRGVSIGRVERIEVAPDSELIQVILKIETDQKLDTSIVAQLKSVGITGSMFVELDRRKEGEEDRSPRLTFPSEYPIVGSKPSDISELLTGLGDVMDHIKSIDLKGVGEKIMGTLDDVSGMIEDVNMKEVSSNVNASLVGVRKIVEDEKIDLILTSVHQAGNNLNILLKEATDAVNNVEGVIERVGGVVIGNEKAIKEAIKGFRDAVATADIFFEKGAVLAMNTDQSLTELKKHLLVVTQNLEMATYNLNVLLELLSEHPSQLLFGEPPAERKIGAEPDKK